MKLYIYQGVFPNHNVCYIAINDSVDSINNAQMDITPFRNITNVAKKGAWLHTICNCLCKAKVIKPSFYKKEMFEWYTDEEKIYDWDTAYVSKILRNFLYAGNLTIAERLTKTTCVPRKDGISCIRSMKL